MMMMDTIMVLTVYLLLYGAIVLVSLTGDQLLRLSRPTATFQYGIAASDSTIHGLIGGLSWAMLAVLQLGSLNLSSLSTTSTAISSPKSSYQPFFSVPREYLSLTALRDVLLCSLLATAIDFDHLFAAKSFSIQKLTTLNRRPVLHNTSLLLLISTVFLLLGHLLGLLHYSSDAIITTATKFTGKAHSDDSPSVTGGNMFWASRIGYLLLMAALSHHIRDGCRRGLNFWPLSVRGGSGSGMTTPPLPLGVYFALLLLLPLALHLVANCLSGGQPNAFGYSPATTSSTDEIISTSLSSSSIFRYSRLDPEAPPAAETVV